MPTVFLALLLAIYPPKPDLSLKFKDISITRAMSLAKTFGMSVDLPIKLEGRIGLLVIELRGKLVQMKLEKLMLDNDASKEPVIRNATAIYSKTTQVWLIRAEALGGIIELEGKLP